MEKQFESSVVESIIFSAYAKFGPQPIYMFPPKVSDEEKAKAKEKNKLKFTYRDYVQISIKNLGLLVADKEISEQKKKRLNYFAVIPHPDFHMTSLTYFKYIYSKERGSMIPSALAVLVHEKKRSFLYNNIKQGKIILREAFEELNKNLKDGYPEQEQVSSVFSELFEELRKLEEKPYLPVTNQRKMKVLFAGLDNSGKTSFLLTLDKKYSKLIGLKPTMGMSVKSIGALGATFLLWDLGGQENLRKKYLDKAQIYLYDSDLIFYFIDINDEKRFEESFEFLQQIQDKNETLEQDTPIVFILTKADPDIVDNPRIRENILHVREKIEQITSQKNQEVFVTSIFSIPTILRAFSSGISKLSPNRQLIKRNLEKFTKETGALVSLILSVDGLILADYYSKQSEQLISKTTADLNHQENEIKNVFEITGPQFTMLYKLYSNFKEICDKESVFKIADSIHIVIKKRHIETDLTIFMLFLIDKEQIKEKIDNNLTNFLERTQDFLVRYIA
ncbi:MAG: ADP-ribosylation factor-like protein [Promethearchaeia archaeon]